MRINYFTWKYNIKFYWLYFTDIQLEDGDACPSLTDMKPFMTIITAKYISIYCMMSDYPLLLVS